MITHRPSADRGHADHGWLEARHSFSFAGYRDPDFMGFRKLRVINEDTVQPGAGFGKHPHDNMEIVTYVIDGSLAHEDTTGKVATIGPGDVQVMTAGSGLFHSEFNASRAEQLHLLQIWIRPEEQDTAPGHAEARFDDDRKRNRLQAIASRDGRDESLRFGADAVIYASILEPGQRLEYALANGRYGWLQVVRGEVEINGVPLQAGDGAAISAEATLDLKGLEECEFLLFDLA